MAKPVYGVRTAMLASTLDTEITLQKDGVGLRPLPIKFVIMVIVSGIACLKVMTSEFVSVGNGLQKIAFAVLWFAITLLLFASDKTKRLNVQRLICLLNYYTIESNRKVKTRRSDPANGMLDICGVKSIEDDLIIPEGLIHFQDKTFGYMYQITGNASVLLFDSDRDAILNANDNFWRKIDAEAEFVFLTYKESQKVYNQAAAIKKRYDNLTIRDPELVGLAEQQLAILREQVGTKYLSIHQYMIIKADTYEALVRAHNTMRSELEGNGLVIKRCVPLRQDAILKQLAVLYTVPKWEDLENA